MVLSCQSVTETRGWSNALAVKIGASVKISATVGVPGVASVSKELTISAEVCNTYTWNGSKSESKSWQFSTPVKVPPYKKYVAYITVCMSTIIVPYVLNAKVKLKSGALAWAIIYGEYTGTNSHDLAVSFSEIVLDNKEKLLNVETIKNATIV